MTQNSEDDSWIVNRKLVLASLERIEKDISTIVHEISAVKQDIALLKFKSGLWGALAGFIPALLALVWFMVTGHMKLP